MLLFNRLTLGGDNSQKKPKHEWSTKHILLYCVYTRSSEVKDQDNIVKCSNWTVTPQQCSIASIGTWNKINVKITINQGHSRSNVWSNINGLIILNISEYNCRHELVNSKLYRGYYFIIWFVKVIALSGETRGSRTTLFYLFNLLVNFSFILCRSFSVHYTVLPWYSGWGVQTVRRYPDWNWLWGLCHSLHLPHGQVQ